MGGIFAVADFVRDDFMPGQGKEVPQLCKTCHITKYELNRIYHVFVLNMIPKTQSINLANLFKSCKVEYTLFASLLFQLFDIHKSGEILFLDFLSVLWMLLTSDDDSLAILCFSLFDIDLVDTLEIEEVLYLMQVIWQFAPPKNVEKNLRKLRLNKDGTITLPEFVLLCKHHSALLAPVKELRKRLRQRIVFASFWKHILKRRAKDFGAPSHALRLMERKKDNYLRYSMDYLNLRHDIVPREYIEQYKLVQRRKASSCKGQVDWPYEVLDHYRTLTQPPSIQGPDELDGFEARSVSGDQHTVHFSVDVPQVLERVLQQGGGGRSSSIYTPSEQQLADMHYIV